MLRAYTRTLASACLESVTLKHHCVRETIMSRKFKTASRARSGLIIASCGNLALADADSHHLLIIRAAHLVEVGLWQSGLPGRGAGRRRAHRRGRRLGAPPRRRRIRRPRGCNPAAGPDRRTRTSVSAPGGRRPADRAGIGAEANAARAARGARRSDGRLHRRTRPGHRGCGLGRHTALRDAIDQGLFPGPRLRISGNAIDILGGHEDAIGFNPAQHLLSNATYANSADELVAVIRAPSTRRAPTS